MSSEDHDNALRTAILEWQKKYGVQDGDPMLAVLELFKLHLGNLSTEAPDGLHFPLFEEFRDTIETLDRLGKTFSKHAVELSISLQGVPDIKRQLSSYHSTAFVLVALFALMIGFFAGRFLW